jgi:branched-chain amino acid transport system substrate-binding protein
MKKAFCPPRRCRGRSRCRDCPALAQTNEITIGITITTTGPAAALGIPERNALDFVPKEIGGVPLKVIVLDDGGDPTNATTNARRFVTESKADIIMGSATTPPTVAVSNVANEAGIPHFGLAPFPITPERAKWSVAMPQPIPIMGKVLYEHMKAHNVKTVGYIGYSDSYGDLWFNDFKAQGVPMGMTMVDEERFARPDTSVAGQVLKLVAANPDAILIGASGTAAALAADRAARARLQGPDLPDPWRRQHGFHPHRRQGGGRRDHGVGSGDGSGGSARQRADQEAGLALNKAYEAKYGPTAAASSPAIPTMRSSARARHPGGAEDGQARNAGIPRGDPPGLMTEKEIAASQGVYNFTEKDRYGLDDRSRIILTVKDGKYVPAK